MSFFYSNQVSCYLCVMKKYRVAAVSYLNTKPFLYGIENKDLKENIELLLDIPSVCSKKLMNGEADIGLVPVAAIPLIPGARIISDFCIGAVGKVRTVNLYSEIPVSDVKKILLDYQSQTSVSLVKILANNLWKIEPEWKNANEGYINDIQGNTAGLVIGDRTFSINGKFRYEYDLASEWYKLTQLPFVFAVWVTNKEIPADFLKTFNEALQYGVHNRHLAVKLWQRSAPDADLHYYFDECISYDLDESKKKAIQKFMNLSQEIEKAIK